MDIRTKSWNVPLYRSTFGKKSETGKTGLINLGNTCFMNSIVQALFMCDRYRNCFWNHILRKNPRAFFKLQLCMHCEDLAHIIITGEGYVFSLSVNGGWGAGGYQYFRILPPGVPLICLGGVPNIFFLQFFFVPNFFSPVSVPVPLPVAGGGVSQFFFSFPNFFFSVNSGATSGGGGGVFPKLFSPQIFFPPK